MHSPQRYFASYEAKQAPPGLRGHEEGQQGRSRQHQRPGKGPREPILRVFPCERRRCLLRGRWGRLISKEGHCEWEGLPVDGDIQAHEINERVVVTKAKQRS